MASALNTSLVPAPKSHVSAGDVDRTSLCHVSVVHVGANATLKALVMRHRRASGYRQLLHRHAFHSLHHEAIHSARLSPVQAQMVEFKARREVSLPFREGAFPAVEYLNELERVVKVTFPDSARITYLGDSIWRTRLKPITFFTLSATPVCDIKSVPSSMYQFPGPFQLVCLLGIRCNFIHFSSPAGKHCNEPSSPEISFQRALTGLYRVYVSELWHTVNLLYVLYRLLRYVSILNKWSALETHCWLWYWSEWMRK